MATRSYKIFAVAGQSNAVGNNGGGISAPTDGYGYYISRTWPLREATLLNDESFQNAFCTAFYDGQSSYTPYLMNYGVGGSDILDNGTPSTNWADVVGGLWETMETSLQIIETYLSGTVTGILWSQGEKNAERIDLSEITKAQYKAGLEDLADRIAASFPNAKLYIVRTGTDTNGDTTGFQEVRAAQDEVAAAKANVIMAYTDTVNFESYGWMYDNLHYDVDGQNDIGADLAEVVINNL